MYRSFQDFKDRNALHNREFCFTNTLVCLAAGVEDVSGITVWKLKSDGRFTSSNAAHENDRKSQEGCDFRFPVPSPCPF